MATAASALLRKQPRDLARAKTGVSTGGDAFAWPSFKTLWGNDKKEGGGFELESGPGKGHEIGADWLAKMVWAKKAFTFPPFALPTALLCATDLLSGSSPAFRQFSFPHFSGSLHSKNRPKPVASSSSKASSSQRRLRGDGYNGFAARNATE